MKKIQRDLLEFHTKLGELEAEHNPPNAPPSRVGASPAVRNVEARIDYIEEEVQEMITAMRSGDVVEMIDGGIDAIYVIVGALIEAGVLDLEPFWDEVHRTNMAKLSEGAVWREDGKLLKPPGWKRPDLASILQEQTRSDS